MSKVEFGADGIRYIAGEPPLDPNNAVRIGRALGQFVCARNDHPVVIMGRDTRPSGGWLAASLSSGLRYEGVDLVDLGIMTTPGVAFVARRQRAELGLAISASHNPAEFNGIKLVGPGGLRLQREEEIEIEQAVNHAISSGEAAGSRQGQETDGEHLIELYIDEHVRRCPAPNLAKLKIVLDCANGAAARVAPAVFERLQADVQVIHSESNAIINDHCGSEHARRHPEDLLSIVRQQGAAYGLAFDGDGDRLIVIDPEGNMFDGDDILYALAVYYHSQNLLRGSAIVTTKTANSGLLEALAALGISTIIAEKGDRSLEAALWRGNFILGGEQTGNIILNDGHHTASDATFTALVLMGAICFGSLTLRQIVAPLVKRPQVIVSLRLARSKPLAEIPQLREEIRRADKNLGPGCRIMTWYSSTEPGLFRVMVEGARHGTREQVDEQAQAICRTMQETCSVILPVA
ncbi:MAG: hypothetical protein WCF84_24780 [Anaerolineae bacterium]